MSNHEQRGRRTARVGTFASMTLVAIAIVCHTTALRAGEYRQREDLSKSKYCDKGFLYLGYGIDPIPCATLPQRWRAWQAEREAVSGTPSVAQPTRATRLPDTRTSSRRPFWPLRSGH